MAVIIQKGHHLPFKLSNYNLTMVGLCIFKRSVRLALFVPSATSSCSNLEVTNWNSFSPSSVLYRMAPSTSLGVY